MTENEQMSFELALFNEAMQGVVGKAVEAVILFQTGDPGLAVMMGGGTGGIAKGLIAGGHRLWSRRKEKLSRAADAARAESRLSLDELLERALDHDDERRVDLLLRAFRQASQEAIDERVRFYGRIAARGVLLEDDAKVDETARIFSAIAALDEADLKVLLHMANEPNQPWSVLPLGGSAKLLAISERLPELGNVLDAVVARLIGLGLLVDRLGDDNYGDAYALSPFARLCVRSLTEDGPESAG